jgi:hypothetical protein
MSALLPDMMAKEGGQHAIEALNGLNDQLETGCMTHFGCNIYERGCIPAATPGRLDGWSVRLHQASAGRGSA